MWDQACHCCSHVAGDLLWCSKLSSLQREAKALSCLGSNETMVLRTKHFPCEGQPIVVCARQLMASTWFDFGEPSMAMASLVVMASQTPQTSPSCSASTPPRCKEHTTRQASDALTWFWMLHVSAKPLRHVQACIFGCNLLAERSVACSDMKRVANCATSSTCQYLLWPLHTSLRCSACADLALPYCTAKAICCACQTCIPMHRS